jgi:RNA polymerase sigma factor (sigma-70 family)
VAHADDGSKALIGIRSGSVEAFDQFYETHAAFVYQIALKMTKNQLEAEDLCHDVFVEVFRHPERFDSSRGSVKAWLAIKTKSRFIDRMRKKKRLVIGLDWKETPDQKSNTEDMVLNKLEREQILSALSHLPDPQRKAVYKKYFEYRTQEEIATVMQKPIGTVKSLIRYGLKNLQKQFSKNSSFTRLGGDHQHERKM